MGETWKSVEIARLQAEADRLAASVSTDLLLCCVQ
jgi:hypothetical protein